MIAQPNLECLYDFDNLCVKTIKPVLIFKIVEAMRDSSVRSFRTSGTILHTCTFSICHSVRKRALSAKGYDQV